MLYPIKIEFKDYPSGSWQDWSEYLSKPPVISKKIESENEGEAGLIVFDDAEVSFRYEASSPVYNAFSIDLTSKQRYLFRISAPKTDKTFVQLFEGIADFSTLRWNEFNNVISFSLVDKLSALNLLQGELTRILDTLDDRVLAQIDYATGIEFRVDNGAPNEIWIKPAVGDAGSYFLESFSLPILQVGEIFRDPTAMYLTLPSNLTYAMVTESWIDAGWNKIKYIKIAGFDYTTWFTELGYYRYPVWFQPNYIAEFGEKEIYGIDILNYNAGIPDSINGFSLIDVIIKKAWADVNIVYRGISSYNLPLNYFILFLDENPLGKAPLDALKMIADSMKCYIFFDKTGGNLIVQSKASLSTDGITRSIGDTRIVSGPKKRHFWDKIIDGVTINVKSWAVDEETGENLVGTAELTKQPNGFSALQKIRPKNSIKRDLLVGDPAVDTQDELNTYAAQEALSILNFYGLRHSSFDLTLNLDDNTINWELIDNLTLNSLITFFTKLEFDIVERTLTIEAIEVTGHDYDFRQLVFGSAEGSEASINPNSGYGGGSYYYGFSPIFNLPLQMSGGIVSLLTTDNLKLTSNRLDTAQPIKITDTPTFNQIILSSSSNSSNQAVRSDRTLQIITNAPLTGGGAGVNLTADRSWTLGINAANLLGTVNQITVVNGTGVVLGLNNVTLSLPQNIHTGATPTFNQLTLSSAGSGSSNAVRADRSINTSSPLSGGGNLTADRTFALNYNATNLKLTSNALNTIQDIAITSSPTFNNLTLSGVITVNGTGLNLFAGDVNQSGNKKFYNNFISGWTGSGWQLDYGVSFAGKSNLEIDSLTVRGSMKVYELIINQIRATNGGLFVSSTAKVKAINNGTVGDVQLVFETPGGNYCPFTNYDILLMQIVDLDSTSVIRKVVGTVVNGTVSGASLEMNLATGKTSDIKIGDVFVRIGNTTTDTRKGTVYLTSDDTASPYIDIYDGVNSYSAWATSAVRKVRLGKLTGLTDSDFGALSGYGLYTTNAYLKGGIWASFGNIAGWTITSAQLSKIYTHPVTGEANEVALNATSNDIGLHVWMDKDAVNVPSMLSIGAIKDYTNTLSANEFGIQYQRGSDTYFRLTNSVQRIAGWNFNNTAIWKLGGGTPTSSPASGIVINSAGAITVYGNYWQKRVALYYSAANNWGLIGTNESYQTVFQLGYTNQIAGWAFDTVKLTKGSATLGISLNTGSTPFITGTSAKGFEVYDYTNPKLFIGKKDGNSLDWNITKADTLTIKGEITTSKFSTNSDFSGSYDYVVIDKDINGHFLTVQKYIDASNTSRVRIQPNGSTDIMSMLHTVSGVTQTINFQYYNAQFNMFINGSPATRYRGNGTTLPTTDLRDGDMYYFTSTGKVYVYAYGAWRVLN